MKPGLRLQLAANLPALVRRRVHVDVRLPALNAAYCASVDFAPAGTDQTLSAVFTSPIATGPFSPRAPTWMCAAIAPSPVVVTLPLTDMSFATVIVPLPLAEVATRGTSSLPVSVTLTFLPGDIIAHPATRSAAVPSPIATTFFIVINAFICVVSL